MMKSGIAAGFCGVLIAASVPGQVPVANAGGLTTNAQHELALTAGSTVLTLEGGVVGLQHLLHFTPLQLRGDLCDSPNRCQPVDYFAMPLGQYFNDQGAVTLNKAIDALPDDGRPVTLYGHSQGGQVIYSALRGWAADPASAPDPATMSWVSIGNPENTFGGRDPDPIPANSPYQGIEVIRQYDGWADWPTDQRNLVAVLNAVIGMNTVHPFYFDVDINSPANLRYVEGNVTYVFVPNPTLPLVQAAAGPLAPLLNPLLDPILRPMVEAGYQRPVGPNPGAAVPRSAAARASVAAAADADPVATPTRSPANRRGAASAAAERTSVAVSVASEQESEQAASPRAARAGAAERAGRR